jgi:hypothetical protein
VFKTLKRLMLVIGHLLFCVAASSAWAQASRTWVSGVGDDANPCSRTAPCKTFAGAISKTAAGGEIDALDPGGYGGVTITKSITIDGGGSLAGVLAASINGIIVSAGANDIVVLRNLSIDGFLTGINGIRFLTGAALHVENVQIFGFQFSAGVTGNGIDFNPSGASKLYVSNSSIHDNDFVGIIVRPTPSGTAAVNISRVQMEHNAAGLYVSDGASVSVSDSVASGNSGAGFQAYSSARTAAIQLERSVSSNNGTYGVRTDGAPTIVWLSNSSIVNNYVGISAGSGAIVSFMNNSVAGSAAGDGAPTSTALQK